MGGSLKKEPAKSRITEQDKAILVNCPQNLFILLS